jgi:hypothetical protein
MKKLIIPGFFLLIGALCLTSFIAVGSIRMDRKEVMYVDKEHSLSDKETDDILASGIYQNSVRDFSKDYSESYKIKKTYSKKFPWWEIKNDTLSRVILTYSKH